MIDLNLGGLKLGDIELLELIGRGSFGQIYRGTVSNGDSVAVKIALRSDDCDLTQALAIYSGSFGKVHPSPEKLLEIQYHRVSSAPELFPRTSEVKRAGTYSYLQMEFLRGVTLRQRIDSKSSFGELSNLKTAIKLYECLVRVAKSKLKFHGDLKPENIMVQDDKIVLLDPGYFGALACEEGMIPNVVVSSPRYYPRLEANDSFAAGAILWELLAGVHPLDAREAGSGSSPRMGERLSRDISYQEMMGRYFLSPLKGIASSVELFDLEPELTGILLASIGLVLSGDSVELDLEQSSFGSILKRLQALQFLDATE